MKLRTKEVGGFPNRSQLPSPMVFTYTAISQFWIFYGFKRLKKTTCKQSALLRSCCLSVRSALALLSWTLSLTHQPLDTSKRWCCGNHHSGRVHSCPSDALVQSTVHVKGCSAGLGPPRPANASCSSLINKGLMSKVIKSWEEEREIANLHSLWWLKCKQLCFRPLT